MPLIARSRGVTLAERRCRPGLAAHADPDRVRQVLANLIDNGDQYVDPRGW